MTQDRCGCLLIADDDFRVGYTVKTGALEGVVESVTIRKTNQGRGRDLHTVPNRLIDNATYIIIPAKRKNMPMIISPDGEREETTRRRAVRA